MALARYRPLGMLSRWPSIWDDEDWGVLNAAGNNLEVYETKDEVVVQANVAGVNAEDVDITFEEGTLWIKAQRQEEEHTEERQHYAQSTWSYSYKVAVPGMIDYSKEPELNLEDGVLTAKFHKSEASKPRKLTVKGRQKA